MIWIRGTTVILVVMGQADYIENGTEIWEDERIGGANLRKIGPRVKKHLYGAIDDGNVRESLCIQTTPESP